MSEVKWRHTIKAKNTFLVLLNLLKFMFSEKAISFYCRESSQNVSCGPNSKWKERILYRKYPLISTI